MPEDKWLWNEPKTWHDIDRALQEISVLLDYLVRGQTAGCWPISKTLKAGSRMGRRSGQYRPAAATPNS